MGSIFGLLLHSLLLLGLVASSHGESAQSPLLQAGNDTISGELFFELEELARIVDIAYCVGAAGLGIQEPFECASHCGDEDFKNFELVTVRPPLRSSVACETDVSRLGIPGLCCQIPADTLLYHILLRSRASS